MVKGKNILEGLLSNENEDLPFVLQSSDENAKAFLWLDEGLVSFSERK